MLIPLGVLITTVMIVFREHPEPLQVSYGVLVVALTYRSVYMHREYRQLAKMGILTSGTPLFVIAFILWNGATVAHACFLRLWHLPIS